MGTLREEVATAGSPERRPSFMLSPVTAMLLPDGVSTDKVPRKFQLSPKIGTAYWEKTPVTKPETCCIGPSELSMLPTSTPDSLYKVIRTVADVLLWTFTTAISVSVVRVTSTGATNRLAGAVPMTPAVVVRLPPALR